MLFKTQKESPERRELRKVQKQVASVQAQLRKSVQRGLSTKHESLLEGHTVRARGLVLELSALTWQAQALQMHMAHELPTSTPASYYYAPELAQWAKVHALATGRFLFEAISEDGQGVLAVLDTFEFLAPWRPSSAEQYRAQLQLQLDGGGVRWNQTPSA